MENATEALHMAFGVLIFVLALSLTISSFGIVRVAGTSIIEAKDKENEYTYVRYTDASGNLETNRIVGKETIIPTMYRAFIERYVIKFYNRYGQPINIYEIQIDDSGNYRETNELDLEAGGIGNNDDANKLIEALVSGNGIKLKNFFDSNHSKGRFGKFQTLGNGNLSINNFYDIIITGNARFKEELGIFYQEDLKANQVEDVNKTEKRVITYTQQ